ncbi:MAG TPA: peptidoglycan-binding protein [Bryobacteraceae bacterium]|nr:peptidoglycan-binding protein [Bryobacteraceae bacterium]
MPYYTIQQGDCLASIAFEYGFFWKTIWDHAENRQLKTKRKDPSVLYAGDVLFIPEKQTKEEPRATDQRHTFVHKGIPEKLHIILKAGDDPIANMDYIMSIDGKLVSGTTGGDGDLEQPIVPNAKQAKLWLGPKHLEYEIRLGNLDPLDEIEGVQARLNNIGFPCGEVDGVKGPVTTAALKRFQRSQGLTESGEIDQKTLQALEAAHLV